MNKPIGAIDGDKAAKWIDNRKSALESAVDQAAGMHKRHLTGQHSALVDFEWELKEGTFALPSDQGEATRLREALNKIIDVLTDDTSINAQRINNIIIEAFSSSHREDGIQKALTIEKLDKMHGKPVLCHIPSDNPHYGVVDLENGCVVLGINHLLNFKYYGEWKAFTIPGITEER